MKETCALQARRSKGGKNTKVRAKERAKALKRRGRRGTSPPGEGMKNSKRKQGTREKSVAGSFEQSTKTLVTTDSAGKGAFRGQTNET